MTNKTEEGQGPSYGSGVEHPPITSQNAKDANDHAHAIANARGWLENIVHLIQRLETAEEQAVDGPDETDAVRTEIDEAPLSVMVRNGWYRPGAIGDSEPMDYEILLTTGGPGLRIFGGLDQYNQPDEWPKLEYQDWGIPWTEYTPAREHRGALQKFASQFYYGD